jgi:hypothetical protein
MPIAPPHSPPEPRGTAAARISLEYVGFLNEPTRRAYRFRARSGADAREYTVSIAHAAFASRQALLQDGPDICFQKLQRAVTEFGLDGATDVAVTESDLATYREAHTTPARRPPSARLDAPSPSRDDGPPPFRRDGP